MAKKNKWVEWRCIPVVGKRLNSVRGGSPLRSEADALKRSEELSAKWNMRCAIFRVECVATRVSVEELPDGD